MTLINNKQTRGVGFASTTGDIVSLIPGWNEISQENLELFKRNTKDLKLVKAGLIEYGPSKNADGKTVYLDFQDLTEEQAEAVLDEGPGTNDVKLLERWKAKEERPGVRLAITKRIEYIKDYKARNDLDAEDKDLDAD